MKWTKEKTEKLINEITKGILYRDIAENLGLTEKAIQVKAQRLGVKSIQNKIKKDNSLENLICNICGNNFKGKIKDSRVYCSSKCSSVNAHNKLNRVNTNDKIRMTHYINNKSSSINRNFKKCSKCSNEFYNSKPKIICEECRYQYYSIYRPSCEFDFELEQYKNKIENYSLIEEYGLYSPSNKGNNLNGVSRDHMVSVKWGFENKISPEIIKHPANCRLLLHKDNNIKKTNNSISYEELLRRIENF